MRKWIREVSSQVTAYTIIGIVGIIGVWLSRWTPVISAFAPLSYLFVFLFAVIVAGIGLALLGRAKREWWPAARDAGDPPATYDDSKLRAEMTQLIETSHSNTEVLAAFAKDAQTFSSKLAAMEELNGKIRDDYQRMNGLEIRLTEALDQLKEAIQADKQQTRSNLAHLQEQLRNLEGGLETQKQRTASSLHAIYLRGKLETLRAEIRRDAADLSHRVSEGQQHDAASWNAWQSVHSHWSSLMSQWWMAARFYLANSREVLLAPDDMYPKIELDESTLVPIGGAEAVRVYKKFRIIQAQWEAVQDQLEDNVCSVAFSGMTELDVRHGQPLEQGR